MTPSRSQAAQVSKSVAEHFTANDRFARLIGIELEEVTPGRSRAAMTLTNDMVNGLGYPHGAAMFALADVAFAAAGNSHGEASVALSMDVHYLRPPKIGGRLQAVAEEVRRGRTTGLYRIRVSQEGKAIAELHGMVYVKGDRFLEGDDTGER